MTVRQQGRQQHHVALGLTLQMRCVRGEIRPGDGGLAPPDPGVGKSIREEGKEMSRTIEDLDRELQAVRAEVEELKRLEAQRAAALRQLAGCFANDPHWTAIHDEIERQRRVPDPDLAEKPSGAPCVQP
jgi:hypothetical protein